MLTPCLSLQIIIRAASTAWGQLPRNSIDRASIADIKTMAGRCPILEDIKQRAEALKSCGLANIWLTVLGSGANSMSAVMGYKENELAEMLFIAGLIKRDGRLNNHEQWHQTIGIPMTWNKAKIVSASKQLWYVRF